MFTKFFFLIAESFRALFRAKLHAAISSITIGIALVIFSLAYIAYINLLGFSYEFKSKYRIEVFFESDLDLSESRDLFNTILIFEGIEQGEFIDKDKASNLFKSYFKEDIYEIIGENPLPTGGRFDIAVNYRNLDKMEDIVKEIRYLSGVDIASFQEGIISRVDSIVENILGASMIFGLIIFFIAVVLVSNTIRLIIHAKQEAIETMHLLGATNSFIRFPFVIEGIIRGLLGAALSVLILYLLRSLQLYLLEPLVKIPLVEPSNIIFYNIVFGLILALFGSFRGISKYLPK